MSRRRGDTETNYEVRSHDARMGVEEYNRLPRNPLYVVLDNLRSAFNVGAVFRLCDALRATGLFLCGYTAHPPHLKLAKTSLGTVDYVPWKHFGDTLEAVAWLRERHIPVWGAETCSHAVRFDRARWPAAVAIVLGNEALGVSREVLDSCDRVVEIPQFGYKNSLNVAAACAVLGFRFVEKRGIAKETAPLREAGGP